MTTIAYRHRYTSRIFPSAISILRCSRTVRRASSTAALAPLSSDQYPGDPNGSRDRGEPPRGSDELSDREWELRTGAAIDLLTYTLPTFFHTGLVTNVPHAPPPTKFARLTGLSASRDQVPSTSEHTIYSPKIRLSYTPPSQLPAPLPRTFHIDGLPLYYASAVFVRHTLSAIYTDLSVDLRSVRVNGVPRSHSEDTPPFEQTEQEHGLGRERSLFIGLAVSGRARVGGGDGHWVVNSTYHFHPVNALVYLHTIDSIVPAPHGGVFDLLRSVLDGVGGRLGLGEGGCVSISPAPQTLPAPFPVGEKGRRG